MRKTRYIAVQDEQPITNNLGKPMGNSPKMALYYFKSIGVHRIYRQAIIGCVNKNRVIRSLTNRVKMQALCDEINQHFGDNFKVVEL